MKSGFYAKVNRTILMTSQGKNNWYDPEDDIYDDEYGEEVLLIDKMRSSFNSSRQSREGSDV